MTLDIEYFTNLRLVQYQYASALVSAVAAGFTIAPFMIVISKSVAMSMTGNKPISDSLFEGSKSLLKPLELAKSVEFQCVLIVYILTYIMSNTSNLLFQSFTFISPSVAKLIASFLVNTTGSMMMDKLIIQKISKTKPLPLPLPSILLFLTRDLIAMASAFTLPPLIAASTHSHLDLSYSTTLSIAQVISPMMIQTINTFIQLLAVNFYNQKDQTLRERFRQVQKRYFSCLMLRIIGFTFAYGLAGNTNLQVKRIMETFKPEL